MEDFGQAGNVKRSPTTNFVVREGEPRSQVGALCWRQAAGKGGVEVLLVTSRETGRWVIPKGWPATDLAAAEAAAREAWEEAGVRGPTGPVIGFFTYDKIIRREGKSGDAVPCVVAVHPLKVTESSQAFPEAGQRRQKWFARQKAAKKVAEPALQTLIQEFDPGSPGGALGDPA